MKHSSIVASAFRVQAVCQQISPSRSSRSLASLIFPVILMTIVFTSCKKQNMEPETLAGQISNRQSVEETELFSGNSHNNLDWQTLWELQQARAATAKYLHISKAYLDGYEDIEVKVENMGQHFMKKSFVDVEFDFRKPELLVYNQEEDGSYTLGAVEYAVPIVLSPNAAPEGFTGSADVWERNEFFGLWLLHAWVWENNPAGVFNPTNPLVHVH